MTESGTEVREDYGALFHQPSDRRCYLRDVPEDILEAFPSHTGRVGYICEFITVQPYGTAKSKLRLYAILRESQAPK